MLDYYEAEVLLTQVVDESEDFRFAFWIEVCGRFIEDDYPRT
jgi:hypothetical protein